MPRDGASCLRLVRQIPAFVPAPVLVIRMTVRVKGVEQALDPRDFFAQFVSTLMTNDYRRISEEDIVVVSCLKRLYEHAVTT